MHACRHFRIVYEAVVIDVEDLEDEINLHQKMLRR